MNRTLKIFFLMLFVSSVSFVYAQDEVDKETGKDTGSISDAGKAGKAGAKDINLGLTAKDAPAKVATAPVSEADRDKMRAGKDGMEKPKGLLGWLKSAFSADKDPDPDPN